MRPDRVLRQLVHDEILERKRTGRFVVNDFKLDMTHAPVIGIEDLHPAGQVWIIALAADDRSPARDPSKFVRDFPVQIALQKRLDDGQPGDPDKTIDLYEDLEDELRDACRNAVRNHSELAFVRIEPLKDENGTPFNYVGLREANTFEAFFTAFYTAGCTGD